MAKSYAPDVVFLDIGMPGMDGYEVARRLRQQPGLENVLLAALTGWGQQEDRRRTAEAGFNHHKRAPQVYEGPFVYEPKVLKRPATGRLFSLFVGVCSSGSVGTTNAYACYELLSDCW